jgi:hypothetical protein
MKRKLVSILVLAVLILQVADHSHKQAFATSATTSVNGSVAASVLNVSVPSALAFSIDPNAVENSYISSEVSIINDTNAPIQVWVGVGSTNFKQSPLSLWKPVDYLPEELDWSNLGKTASENSLALGIKISNPVEWRTVFLADTLWVKEQNSLSSAVIFGELNALSAAKVSLEVYHGNAFSEIKSCQYDIVWSFALAN